MPGSTSKRSVKLSMYVKGAQVAVVAIALLGACGCKRAVVQASSPLPVETRELPLGPRQVRATGTVQAVRKLTIQVPQITGQNGRITLVRLIPSQTYLKF